MREIILASASPRRSALLREWGIPFQAVPPQGLDESLAGAAADVARQLAREKAEWALKRFSPKPPDLLVAGADTVVEFTGATLGKPRDREEARRMLERLSGRDHRVVTAVAVFGPGTAVRVETETSEVTFRALRAEEIEGYLDTGDWQGKAGAYGIQSEGRRLVSGFRGCYYNIVGLPMRRLLSLLGERRSCDCARHPLCRGGEGCA